MNGFVNVDHSIVDKLGMPENPKSGTKFGAGLVPVPKTLISRSYNTFTFYKKRCHGRIDCDDINYLFYSPYSLTTQRDTSGARWRRKCLLLVLWVVTIIGMIIVVLRVRFLTPKCILPKINPIISFYYHV